MTSAAKHDDHGKYATAGPHAAHGGTHSGMPDYPDLEPEVPEAPPEPIIVGDVVKLCVSKCAAVCVEGSPAMTVVEMSGNGKDCICRWFTETGAFYQQTFPVDELARPDDHVKAKAAAGKVKAAADKVKADNLKAAKIATAAAEAKEEKEAAKDAREAAKDARDAAKDAAKK